MILLFHITSALASLGATTYLWMTPSDRTFKVVYALAGLTLLSGIYLVASQPAHMLQGCTTGLIYIGLVSAGLIGAHRKSALTRR